MRIQRAGRRQARDEDGRILVESADEIPSFGSDDDELDFWQTHTLGDSLLKEMTLGDPLDIAGDAEHLPKRSSATLALVAADPSCRR